MRYQAFVKNRKIKTRGAGRGADWCMRRQRWGWGCGWGGWWQELCLKHFVWPPPSPIHQAGWLIILTSQFFSSVAGRHQLQSACQLSARPPDTPAWKMICQGKKKAERLVLCSPNLSTPLPPSPLLYTLPLSLHFPVQQWQGFLEN